MKQIPRQKIATNPAPHDSHADLEAPDPEPSETPTTPASTPTPRVTPTRPTPAPSIPPAPPPTPRPSALPPPIPTPTVVPVTGECKTSLETELERAFAAPKNTARWKTAVLCVAAEKKIARRVLYGELIESLLEVGVEEYSPELSEPLKLIKRIRNQTRVIRPDSLILKESDRETVRDSVAGIIFVQPGAALPLPPPQFPPPLFAWKANAYLLDWWESEAILYQSLSEWARFRILPKDYGSSPKTLAFQFELFGDQMKRQRELIEAGLDSPLPQKRADDARFQPVAPFRMVSEPVYWVVPENEMPIEDSTGKTRYKALIADLWLANRVQALLPELKKQFNVKAVHSFGIYSHRVMIGTGQKNPGFSRHASALAIDIGGFEWDDGLKASVLDAYKKKDESMVRMNRIREYLEEKKIFHVVMGPWSNRAHNNHFHLDLDPKKRPDTYERSSSYRALLAFFSWVPFGNAIYEILPNWNRGSMPPLSWPASVIGERASEISHETTIQPEDSRAELRFDSGYSACVD